MGTMFSTNIYIFTSLSEARSKILLLLMNVLGKTPIEGFSVASINSILINKNIIVSLLKLAVVKHLNSLIIFELCQFWEGSI